MVDVAPSVTVAVSSVVVCGGIGVVVVSVCSACVTICSVGLLVSTVVDGGGISVVVITVCKPADGKFVVDDEFTVVVVGYSDVDVDFCGVVFVIANVEVDIAALVAVVCSAAFVGRRGIVDVAIDVDVSVVAVLKKGLVSNAVCVLVVSKALVVELCAAVADTVSDDV